MVQSVKRALKVDANHPELHSCLIRLFRFLQEGQLLDDQVSNAAVVTVLKTETDALFDQLDATQLNARFLERNANSLPHLFQGHYSFIIRHILRFGRAKNSENHVFRLFCSLVYGNFCPASARLSPGRHPPFPYYWWWS